MGMVRLMRRSDWVLGIDPEWIGASTKYICVWMCMDALGFILVCSVDLFTGCVESSFDSIYRRLLRYMTLLDDLI